MMTTSTEFWYQRGTDGCDSTWDIFHPDGKFLVSIHFWEAADETEADAKLIVHRLNMHGELLAALDYLLEQTVDRDLKYGIGLSEGEADARAKAIAVIRTAKGARI